MLQLDLNFRHFVWIAMCSLLSPVAGAGEPQRDSADEIAKLEEQWNRAHLEGDAETLDRLWARDLIIIVPRRHR